MAWDIEFGAMIDPPDVPFMCSDGAIFAGAGSGKTTTSIALHYHAHSQGKAVIMITFTNATMEDYIRRADGVRSDLASAQNVFTFHKLAGLILQEGNAVPDINLSTDTIVPLAVEHIQQHGLCESLLKVDVILVDESQDCSLENYELVKCVGESAKATIVMIGDANQCLYRFRNADPSYLLSHKGFRHELKTNYRSTPQIVAMSQRFMRHPIDVSSCAARANGLMPRLVIRKASAAVDFIIAAASEQGRGTTMLIGRSKQPRYEKNQMVRMGLQTVVNEMTRRNLPFKRMFKETSDDEPMAGGQSMDTSCVNVMTIHGSKGLEADTVIVIDAVEEMLGDEQSPDQLELMYVAFSRPRSVLIIVNIEGAKCDSTLHGCVRSQLCVQDGSMTGNGIVVTRNIQQRHTVTQLLSDRTIIGEKELLDLSRMIIRECKVVGHADETSTTTLQALPEVSDLRALYGQLAENCLQMAYNSARYPPDSVEANVMGRLDSFVTSRLIVPAQFETVLQRLFVAAGARPGDAITPDEVASIKAQINPEDSTYSRMNSFLEHVSSEMERRNMQRAVLTPASVTQVVRIPELINISARYARAKSNRDRLPHLFRATLFFFQLAQHAGYRWHKDYSAHVRSFQPILVKISKMARLLPENCVFEKRVSFKQLRLAGRMDVVTSSRIVEAKFSSSLSLLHFLQPSFYGLLDGGKYPKKCESWNLATGERVLVRYNDDPEDRWLIMEALAKLLDRKVNVTDLVASNQQDGKIKLESETLRARRIVDNIDIGGKWFDVGVSGLRWRT